MQGEQKAFILLTREFLISPLYPTNRNVKTYPLTGSEAWIDLILMASDQDDNYWLSSDNCKKIPLRRGELVASRRYLGKRWGWSAKKVHRFLSALKKITNNGLTEKVQQGENLILLYGYTKIFDSEKKVQQVSHHLEKVQHPQGRFFPQDNNKNEEAVEKSATPLKKSATGDLEKVQQWKSQNLGQDNNKKIEEEKKVQHPFFQKCNTTKKRKSFIKKKRNIYINTDCSNKHTLSYLRKFDEKIGKEQQSAFKNKKFLEQLSDSHDKLKKIIGLYFGLKGINFEKADNPEKAALGVLNAMLGEVKMLKNYKFDHIKGLMYWLDSAEKSGKINFSWTLGTVCKKIAEYSSEQD
jgi:hypothetical protein